MEKTQKYQGKIGVKLIADTNFSTYEDIAPKTITKSDTSEQLNPEDNHTADSWIPHRIDMNGLNFLVEHSTILPQCIRAYKNNIAGFGIEVKYDGDFEENDETKKEWDSLQRILDVFNFDKSTKEIFEDLIENVETYGLGYLEVLRNIDNDVVGLYCIDDVPDVDMTYPMEPFVEANICYKGEIISRNKKFKKYRQTVNGKVVYFKEFGDPRIMNKTNGEYVNEGDKLDLSQQANEIIEIKLGKGYYGTPRWLGNCITADGMYRAENLNNNYFRNGRHTPLMIIVRGGTLSDSSFAKLEEYMNAIRGEKGQHAFLLLEAEKNDTTTDFEADNQPNVEIKDLANILQRDELFQEYQGNGRKKIQSSFLLPDLYVGYTTDFNRATSQAAMEVTEKQVFQPERGKYEWIVNQKLLNGYGFKYVKVEFTSPDITNPDDIMKLLNISERGGGLTLNEAHEVTALALGREVENYPDAFDMNDIGNVPLALISKMPALYNFGNENAGGVDSRLTAALSGTKQLSNNASNKPDGKVEEGSDDVDMDLDTSNNKVTEQLDQQINKAIENKDDDVVSVMKEVKRLLIEMGGESSNENI